MFKIEQLYIVFFIQHVMVGRGVRRGPRSYSHGWLLQLRLPFKGVFMETKQEHKTLMVVLPCQVCTKVFGNHKTEELKAYFVHCYAHCLNLVVVAGMCCKKTATRNCFGMVEQLWLGYIRIDLTRNHQVLQWHSTKPWILTSV